MNQQAAMGKEKIKFDCPKDDDCKTKRSLYSTGALIRYEGINESSHYVKSFLERALLDTNFQIDTDYRTMQRALSASNRL